MTHDLELPCDVDSPARARQSLGALTGQVPEAVLGDLRLLVSELVTNALRHSGIEPTDRIGLRVEVLGDGAVRVEVTDPGRAEEPRLGTPEPAQAGGWGLYLVEALADRWGVERDGFTRVWFEIASSR